MFAKNMEGDLPHVASSYIEHSVHIVGLGVEPRVLVIPNNLRKKESLDMVRRWVVKFFWKSKLAKYWAAKDVPKNSFLPEINVTYLARK